MKKCCPDKNGFVEFLIKPQYRIYRHLLILLYITVVFLYDTDDIREHHGAMHDYVKLLWIGYFLVMFYFNMYVLVPRLLFKEKYLFYLFSLTLATICGYLILNLITIAFFDGYRLDTDIKFLNSAHDLFVATNRLTIMVFSSTSVKLFQRWATDNSRMNELETNSLQAELRELKNQINPHFLFNMLNNVNVLVKTNPDKASLIILKLSDFLRYQLYGSDNHSVTMASEVQFLNDFMDLEKIRRDDFHYTITIQNNTDNPDAVGALILPPNLFTTFIENALKHSSDPENCSHVEVVFSLYDDRLVFCCTNTKPTESLVQRKAGGLGLSNIRRRLELLYAKRFKLETEDMTAYKVTLTLPL